jgi:hypothetical protein
MARSHTPGRLKVALGAQDVGEVVEASSGVGVVDAQACLASRSATAR